MSGIRIWLDKCKNGSHKQYGLVCLFMGHP